MSASVLDLLVTGGTLVTPEGLVRADLGLQDGRIAAVAPASPAVR